MLAYLEPRAAMLDREHLRDVARDIMAQGEGCAPVPLPDFTSAEYSGAIQGKRMGAVFLLRDVLNRGQQGEGDLVGMVFPDTVTDTEGIRDSMLDRSGWEIVTL
jgi:hypothetical protein